MNRTLLLLLVLFVEGIFISRFMFNCEKLADRFYFSSFDVRLMVESDTHNDLQKSPVNLKLFHNKIIISVVQGIDHTLPYLDSNFLINSLSFVGFFGFLAGLYYLVRNLPLQKALIVFLSIIILPMIEEILRTDIIFPLKFILLMLPFAGVSFYGSYHYLDKARGNKRYLFVILLILLSIWWFVVFSGELTQYCFLK